ncbi:hypothetical protein AAW00_04390 [Aurantiacibacter luteus]|uniref:RecA-like protein n=2 Tax=Aurantiacibacter luteus TaxID=1581420 RepID=A0A0G9N2A5_9SPHN|nr:hypothetical protein AAW00_04390 [Aurantiacibacter luteus]
MRAGELASAGALAPRWQPGAAHALHAEVFAPATEGSGAGLALALARDGLRTAARAAGAGAGMGAEAEEKPVLWVQDKRARRLAGTPYRPGLPRWLAHRLIHVAADKPEDALFALEEGVRCRDLACVIGELAGNPKALDFTASRRLTLAAERHGVPLVMVRLDAEAELSSARMRWRARAAPSAPPLWNTAAPGRPAWHAELFRARGHIPGEWILRDEDDILAAERPATGTTDHGDLVPGADARSLATL